MTYLTDAVLFAAAGAAPQTFDLSVIAAVIVMFSAMGYLLTRKR